MPPAARSGSLWPASRPGHGKPPADARRPPATVLFRPCLTCLNRAGLPQMRDLVVGISEFGEDRGGMLAIFGRAADQPARRAAERHRLADQRDLTQRRRRDGLRDAEMTHLRIG